MQVGYSESTKLFSHNIICVICFLQIFYTSIFVPFLSRVSGFCLNCMLEYIAFIIDEMTKTKIVLCIGTVIKAIIISNFSDKY